MKNKRKYAFLVNSAIGFLVGFYIVYLALDEKGIVEGSNKGVLFTVLSSLIALTFLRILIYRTSQR